MRSRCACRPGPRHAAALTALDAGKHVLLEKPPGATLSEVDDLIAAGRRRGRDACSPPGIRASPPASRRRRDWLAGRTIRSVRDRLEGGCARLASGPGLDLGAGRLRRVRSGHQRAVDRHRDPADADLPHRGDAAFPAKPRRSRSRRTWSSPTLPAASASPRTFDWRQTGPQTWDIRVVHRRRRAAAADPAGRKLVIKGEPVVDGGDVEYAAHLQPIRRADRGGRERRRLSAAAPCRRRLHGRPARVHGAFED